MYDEDSLQDLKIACQILMVNDTMKGDAAILHHILRRLANLHARSFGYKDWADAYQNIM